MRAYQGVPSPKSLAWAGPYASGRTPTWPTSTQPEPATHRTEAINRHDRTRQTHRQRLPQPHQLQTPNAPHHRRPRCLHPHSTLKSQFCAEFECGVLLLGGYLERRLAKHASRVDNMRSGHRSASTSFRVRRRTISKEHTVTTPITSNGPTTTRVHHYAEHY